MEQYTAHLESITINGTMPDDSRPVSMAVLKDLLKDNWACTKDLSQACTMAQALMPKLVQEKAIDKSMNYCKMGLLLLCTVCSVLLNIYSAC